MVIPGLNPTTIRHHTTPQSFQRGHSYYQDGAVSSLVQRGPMLQAEVEGSAYEPYRITIHFDPGGVREADCTCPYDGSGWCKHIVAVLLACVHEPARVEQRPSLEQLLDPLTREQLQSVLQRLAADRPELVDAIAGQIPLVQAPPTAEKPKGAPRRTTVDPKPFRRQVQQILQSVAGYWDDEPALDKIRGVLQKARDFLEHGDADNALVIGEALTAAYVEEWMNLDGSSGASGDFFRELDALWTEAFLSTELTKERGADWRAKVAAWQGAVEEYGVEDAFAMSTTALAQGWHYPPLKRVLQGEISDTGMWAGEVPEYAAELAGIRLRILAHQGRYEEYLHLAEAEGQMAPYLTMLVQVGRVEEAVEQALRRMSATDEALALAKALRERGVLDHALRIAAHGLTLEGEAKHPLAAWTSELAQSLGHPEQALQATILAFQASPSLNDYLKARELAGEQQWPALRQQLLARLRKQRALLALDAQVEVFLHENLLDDAIAVVDKVSSYQATTVHQVMDAAIETRPEWVIKNACQRAESTMNEGKAESYHHAIAWLKQARAAYCRAGRVQAWETYANQLLQQHARKYKLRALLQRLE
jgi:uncharacterized Zn finger protein